jgi:hypothetical protein
MSSSNLNRILRVPGIVLLSLIIGTAGVFLQIGGTSWDVTSHIMREPETFFTPSHTVLYTGIGLLTISAVMGGVVFLEGRKDAVRNTYSTSYKLLVIGSAVSLVAGPADFLWHETFGVDGLLSPPHLALITGMLINSMAVVVGLVRLRYTLLTPNKEKIVRLVMIPAFAALWFTIIWYVYMFSLPFSNGENFQLNPDPILAILITTTFLPLLSSIVFLTASSAVGRLGGATAVAVLVVALNSFANLIPVDESMILLLPWYTIMTIFPAIVADLALNYLPKRRIIDIKNSELIAGAIIGCIFYMFNFPMIAWVFGNPLGMNFDEIQSTDAISNLYSDFQERLMSMIGITILPGALMGILGGIIVSSKICLPPKMILDSASNKNTEVNGSMTYITDE